jgi:hypothetical protein
MLRFFEAMAAGAPAPAAGVEAAPRGEDIDDRSVPEPDSRKTM